MSSAANKALVQRLFDECVNQRNYDVLDKLIAADFVLHSAMLGEVHGREAYKQSVRALLDPCPDLQGSVEALIAGEQDTVVARLTYRGTDTGGLARGHAATGKPFEFTAIYLWQVANGQLAELWQEADRARMLQQLGLLPA